MGIPTILSGFFSSTQGTARRIVMDAQQLRAALEEHRHASTQRFRIIAGLPKSAAFAEDLERLQRLLEIEENGERASIRESVAVRDELKDMEHEEHLRRVHRLEQCLDYADTAYAYMHKLLEELHATIHEQRASVERLRTAPAPKDLERLMKEAEIEAVLLDKIAKVDDFHEFFQRLLSGERVVQTLRQRERRMRGKMAKGIQGIFGHDLSDGVSKHILQAIYDGIEDQVHAAIPDGGLIAYHENVDLEWVNRPEFVAYVENVIKNVRRKPVSKDMLNVFVKLFREYYNAR